MSRVVSRRPSAIIVGFLLVTSLVVTGISGSGVVAGQTANGTNATNNTSTGTSQGQLGRLNASNGTTNGTQNETGSGNVYQFAKSLQDMNGSAAKQAVKQNPAKASNILSKLESSGVSYSKQKFLKDPKKVAKAYMVVADDTPRQAGAGGSGGGRLFGFSMRKDVINPTMNSTKTMLADGFTWMLNKSLETTIGTPVPKDNNDDGIVMVPTNEPWKSLYHNYFVPYIFPLATVLALLGMIIECGIMPWRALRNPTYSQSRAFVTFVLTLAAIIFTMPIITVMHSFIDILATNVAPSTAQLTKSTKGIMNLSGGAIAGVIAAYGLGFTEVLMLAFIYALRYGSLFILPWFLPLLIALTYNAPHDRLSGLASELLWQYIGILIQAFPVALLFRAAYEMEWDLGLGGFMGVLASGAIFLIAAALPLITSIGMFKAAPSIQSVATGAAGYVAGSRATDYSRQATGKAARGGYQRMANVKNSITERIQSLRGSNGPERGQSTINDFEDRTHPNTGIPKNGEL